LVWATIKDNPDFWIRRVDKLLYSFYEATLRWRLPPLGTVAPSQDTGMQNIEPINDKKGTHESPVLISPVFSEIKP
jgi:hypothetical protein